ncbi:hypothetical protein [Croceicoccus estronivorus]|uniref:hypothetical protein n=1 Tax=Croceicoccus estronivorus TaxID=1172626 RepID=UPI0014786908|nr:hypothetical protein [Croceicoccus estronivorus]
MITSLPFLPAFTLRWLSMVNVFVEQQKSEPFGGRWGSIQRYGHQFWLRYARWGQSHSLHRADGDTLAKAWLLPPPAYAILTLATAKAAICPRRLDH